MMANKQKNRRSKTKRGKAAQESRQKKLPDGNRIVNLKALGENYKMVLDHAKSCPHGKVPELKSEVQRQG